MIEVDKSLLSKDALDGIIYQYIVVSMGNEFDEQPMSEKTTITLNAIELGDLKIIYCEIHEEVRLISKDELVKQSSMQIGQAVK